MKFTDGYWQIKKGVTIHNPVDVSDVSYDDKSLTVYSSCKAVLHRGDTLNSHMITTSFTSPFPDVICIKIFHHKGLKSTGPEFDIFKSMDTPIEIMEKENIIVFKSGNISAVFNRKGPYSVDYFYNNKRITGSTSRNTGYIQNSDNEVYLREQLDLDVGECVYGLGERFTPFVKNGQVVDMWNEDGGTSSELAYKNIPFYLTNKGYGVFVNSCDCVSFEIVSEVVEKIQFSLPGECLEYYIIGGDSLKGVLGNYTKLTGKPALPPAWSFGLWLTTSFTTSYDEATVNSFIDGMYQRNLPLHVFHFDCFWMKEYQWCDFEWDSEVFPDPENMLKRIKDKGLKICVWINSYIAQKSPLFDECMQKGYLLKNTNGDVWQWDMWQAGMGIIDFTNPAATEWFKGKLKHLLDMGVDCFKTDFGERIPTNVVYFDGSDPVKMHNYYTYLYNKAVYEVLVDARGKGDAVVFARSATVGSQKFPVHWGGDCSANYPSMAETLRGGLSLGLSGFGFWSHDISGFEKTASPDVYKRWVAFGLLSSHSRLHGSESYRVPWLFDEEAVDVLRFFTNLKCSLMPYLYKSAVEATSLGLPLVRAMVLEFPDDPACDYLDRQYMLGDSLLVAPIFNAEGEAVYYLPEGKWTYFITGESVQGGCWSKEHYDYMSLPLMVRPNSLIAVGTVNTKPDYDYADGVTLHLFEPQPGKECSTVIYDTEGKLELRAVVTTHENMLCIDVESSGKPWSVLIRGKYSVSSVENATSQIVESGVKLMPLNDAGHLNLTIKQL